jgi:hypothetical protein
VRLPLPSEGGIFGSSVTADRRSPADSTQLVGELEKALLSDYGVLFDAWIELLLSHDLANRVVVLFNEFVAAVASGSNGLEQRFAKKVAIVFAAGKLAVEEGLLPWPEDWPMRAARHCYMNSLKERDPGEAATTKSVRLLARRLRSDDAFPRFDVERGRYPRWTDNQIGFHWTRAGKTETLFAKGRLHLVGDADEFVETRVFERLLELKVVSASDNATASEQLRVRSPSGEIVKARFWRLNSQRLEEWVRTASGCARRPDNRREARGAKAKDAGKRRASGQVHRAVPRD